MKKSQAKFCLFRCSDDLKEIVKFTMKARGYSVSKLSRELRIDRTAIGRYLNEDHMYSDGGISQANLLRICLHLGIEPSVKFQIIA